MSYSEGMSKDSQQDSFDNNTFSYMDHENLNNFNNNVSTFNPSSEVTQTVQPGPEDVNDNGLAYVVVPEEKDVITVSEDENEDNFKFHSASSQETPLIPPTEGTSAKVNNKSNNDLGSAKNPEILRNIQQFKDINPYLLQNDNDNDNEFGENGKNAVNNAERIRETKGYVTKISIFIICLGLTQMIVSFFVLIGYSRNFLFYSIFRLNLWTLIEEITVILLSLYHINTGALLLCSGLVPATANFSRAKFGLFVISFLLVLLSALLASAQLIYFAFMERNGVKLLQSYKLFPLFFDITFWAFSFVLFASLLLFKATVLFTLAVAIGFLLEIRKYKRENPNLSDLI